MLKILILLAICLISLSAAPSKPIIAGTFEFKAATCTGAKTCKACKNCKYCKHCSKNGGHCGVCK